MLFTTKTSFEKSIDAERNVLGVLVLLLHLLLALSVQPLWPDS